MLLIVATRNRDKWKEIAELWQVPGVRLSGAFDYPEVPEVEEDGETFEANAVKKAVCLARATERWSLADDSGLEVDALGGRPGVFSARYAGEPSDFAANNRKLLAEMAGKADRRACFRCVIALAAPSGQARTVEGACEGTLAGAPRGSGGFGYDPLFIPDGHEKTFAELGSDLKHRLSHRGKAIRAALAAWGTMLSAHPDDWPRV